jgi:hypothetical protein
MFRISVLGSSSGNWIVNYTNYKSKIKVHFNFCTFNMYKPAIPATTSYLLRMPRFDPRPIHMGCFLDKVALGLLKRISVFLFHYHSTIAPYSHFSFIPFDVL